MEVDSKKMEHECRMLSATLCWSSFFVWFGAGARPCSNFVASTVWASWRCGYAGDPGSQNLISSEAAFLVLRL